MIPVGIIPVLVVAGVSTLLISHQIRIEQVIASTVHDLELLASDPKLIGPNVSVDERKRELTRITRPGFPEISLLDRSGFIVETTGKVSEVQDYSPWFSTALAKHQTIVSSPYRQADNEKLLISFYIPAASGQSSQTAIIKATLSFDRISEILDSVGPSRSDFLALVDGRGNLLDATTDDLPHEALKQIGLQNRQSAEPHGTYHFNDSKFLVYSAHEVSPPNQIEFTRTWMLTYFRDPHGAMAIVYQSRSCKAIAATIGIFLSLLLGWFLSKRVSRQISVNQGPPSDTDSFKLEVFAPEPGSRRTEDAS